MWDEKTKQPILKWVSIKEFSLRDRFLNLGLSFLICTKTDKKKKKNNNISIVCLERKSDKHFLSHFFQLRKVTCIPDVDVSLSLITCLYNIWKTHIIHQYVVNILPLRSVGLFTTLSWNELKGYVILEQSINTDWLKSDWLDVLYG